MNSLRVTYHVLSTEKEVQSIAEDIALEQTVEVPAALAQDQYIQDNILGKIHSINLLNLDENIYEVIIDYNPELTGNQIPQFLNLIYGNVSLKRGIQVHDFEMPNKLAEAFRGPRYGINGIREILGVYDRPLLSTAIKPKGSPNETFAQIAHDFALGGGDIVKDDHNLVDNTLHEFRERVALCHEAVLKANKQTGRQCLFFPSIMASVEMAEKQLEIIMQLGIRGVLISPMVIGLDYTRYLAKKYPVIFMAHPTFTGASFYDPRHGMDPGLFLGKIFRMIGCDVSVFPNYGGRFTFSQDDCHSICNHLRNPLGNMETAFPAPAGGMKYDNIQSMSEEFGADTVFLIGGALLSYSDNLTESTSAFKTKINQFFKERLEEPHGEIASACDLPIVSQEKMLEIMKFKSNFTWKGRKPVAYKASNDLPFKDVTRFELVGKSGESTAFDLRYFQIEPKGYSSKEKHYHTHVIIGVRGKGILEFENNKIEIKPNDIAYVKPMQVHQLINKSKEPFGFYCIVDRERDKPMKA